MVVMIPAGEMRRMRLFSVSATKMLPALSDTALRGALSWAAVARPPSPAAPPVPVPASVEIVPSDGGGTVVSTVQLRVTGAATLPAVSVAVTENECGPSASPEYVTGEVQPAAGPPSRRQVKVAGSLAPKEKEADVDDTVPVGPPVIDVMGGVVSGPCGAPSSRTSCGWFAE